MGDRCWWPRSNGCLPCGGISWFMLFYDKCNGPLVGTYNIWLEVLLNF
jgi:hypothetical protein